MAAEFLSRGSAQRRLAEMAAAFMIAAGVIHLLIAPLHGAHALAHGWFHLASGVAQVAWGIAFWRKPTKLLVQVGIVLAGSLITLYGITRLMPAPFSNEIEAVEFYGIVSKLCEGIVVAVLSALLVVSATMRERRSAAWRTVVATLGAAILIGGLTYGVASAAQPLLPWLGEGAEVAATPASVVQHTEKSDNLQWLLGGIARPFQQGGEIAITGNVLASVTVNRSSDQRGEREIDLQLYHTTTANPIDDADVLTVTQMRYMDHGQFKTIALHSNGGHYLLPVKFAMPGEWQVEVEISTPGKYATLQLLIDVFD